MLATKRMVSITMSSSKDLNPHANLSHYLDDVRQEIRLQKFQKGVVQEILPVFANFNIHQDPNYLQLNTVYYEIKNYIPTLISSFLL